MPEFIDWSAARDRDRIVQRLREALDQGAVVVLPTEVGYGLALRSDRPEGLTRLPDGGLNWSLVLPEKADVRFWTKSLHAKTARLLRRTWPGPAAYEFTDVDVKDLHVLVSDRVAPGNTLMLRKPAHEAILDLMDALEVPLVLAEPERGDGEWIAALGDSIALVLEDGRPRFDQPATRVRVDGANWSIVQPGVYDESELRRLTACLILFVCTGNTCRSPMAEAIAKAMLAERLDCTIDELPERGFWVMSAGVSAFPGDSAALEAQAAVRAFGGDLSGHSSRVVRPELVETADHVVAMTQGHRTALYQLFPDSSAEPKLLCGNEDLTDPLGSDQTVYDECARIIKAHLEGLIAEVTQP